VFPHLIIIIFILEFLKRFPFHAGQIPKLAAAYGIYARLNALDRILRANLIGSCEAQLTILIN